MPSTTHLSQAQRVVLAEVLQSRLAGFERDRVSQLHGLTQAESARQTLLQDADDGRQRAGEHEVEGIVSDIDSGEFSEIRDALQRIHGDGYGLCADCHAAIPFRRLRLEPQALRCGPCQRLHELSALP
jgi:RNA polymerase-binding transcription factor DksA